MNTIQLECFLAVTEYLNFSKAADSVNITQPAVSHQISSLEDELGVKLFLRTSKSVSLTPEGTQFISDAEAIMKIAATAKHRLSEKRADTAVRIGIGCHNTAELDAVSPVLRKLSKIYPNLQPILHLTPFKSLDNMLADNKVEVIVAAKGIGEKRKLGIFTELCRCPMACICSDDYPLAEYSSLKENQLKGKAVLIERHSCSDYVFACQNRIMMTRSAGELIFCDGYETGLSLVKSGLGFMIFPLMPNITDNSVRCIPITDFEPASLGLYYKSLQISPVLKSFVRIAEDEYGG